MTRAFAAVFPINDVEGYMRVSWALAGDFSAKGPYSYRLQVAPTSVPSADDWQDVGPAAGDVTYLVDDIKRDHGKTLDHHYRIVLTAGADEYYSHMFSAEFGDIDYHSRKNIREFIRQFRKKASKFTGTAGRIMKRKRYGPKCVTCTDEFTGEPTRADCPECYGAGITGGYHEPSCLLYGEKGLTEYREHVDDSLQLQTIKPEVTTLEVMGFPLLSSKDVWIEDKTGLRYFVEKIRETSALRGYVYGNKVDILKAPFSDPIYKVYPPE